MSDEELKALARPDCQRSGCGRPAVYAVIFDYPCFAPHAEETGNRHRLGSSLGACEECRPYFLEKILPELVRDLVTRGISKDLQFHLIKIEE